MTTTITEARVVLNDKTDTVYAFEILAKAELVKGESWAKGAWADNGIPAALATINKAVGPWHKAFTDEATQTNVIADAVLDIREQILLPSGVPDWAGNTIAYSAAFSAQFLAACKRAKMGENAIDRLRTRIRENHSSNGKLKARMAAWAVANDKTLAKAKGKLSDGTEITAAQLAASAVKGEAEGVAIATVPELLAAVATQHAAQVTPKGKALNGFTEPLKSDVTFGKRVRGTGTGRVEPTPGAKVDSVTSVLAGTGITFLAKAQEFSYLATALADGIVGAPSQKETGMPDLGTASDQAAAFALIEKASALLALAIEYRSDPDTKLIVDHVHDQRMPRPTSDQ